MFQRRDTILDNLRGVCAYLVPAVSQGDVGT